MNLWFWPFLGATARPAWASSPGARSARTSPTTASSTSRRPSRWDLPRGVLNAAPGLLAGRRAPRAASACGGRVRRAALRPTPRSRVRPAQPVTDARWSPAAVRSGKSRHAEDLLRSRADVTYVATGRRADPTTRSGAERVAAHRARRPGSWRTVETTDVAGVLARATGPVLVDCLGTWLTAIVDDGRRWDDLERAAAVRRSPAPAKRSPVDRGDGSRRRRHERGRMALVPTTASGRFFQDELGRLNAAVAGAAARVAPRRRRSGARPRGAPVVEP